MGEGGACATAPRREQTEKPASPSWWREHDRARGMGDEGGEEGRGQIRKGLVMMWSWEPYR